MIKQNKLLILNQDGFLKPFLPKKKKKKNIFSFLTGEHNSHPTSHTLENTKYETS